MGIPRPSDPGPIVSDPGPSDRRPSDRIGPASWARAHDELVEHLRALIRIPSVNPPGDEIGAARYVADVLEQAGVRATVVEPFPGRGSVVARLRGDGSGGGPLLLLSHLDVVPAPLAGWTHDPFGGEVDGGYVWGRGALDMKGMVAMELAVLRQLAAEARAAGLDPASDPIPGLRRDVLFASTADEEAGGHAGIGWLVEHHPDWLQADGALNEAGGVSVEFAGHRFYPIQVAEKGFVRYLITVHGTWGHGSMPREDNAAVRAAAVVSRLAVPGPSQLTPAVARALERIAAALPAAAARHIRAIASPDRRISEAALDALCEPAFGRAARALLRDTVSPNIIRAGLKYNVIPGVAEVELDVRTLPGTDEATFREQLRDLLDEELRAVVEIEPVLIGQPVEAPIDSPLYELLERTIVAHDPEGIPLPILAPFATDAKHTIRLGIPTYGFSPLRLRPEDRFLELFHGDDERVSLAALRFGLPVLYDVVRGFCA